MKLTAIQRIFTYLTLGLLFFSGIVWLIFNFFFDHDTPLRFLSVWSLRLHGFAAFGFLIIFGMILATHISFNWRVKKNRRLSGIILTAILMALIISGYCLYYFGDEDWRTVISYFHWIAGLVCAVPFAFHRVVKKKNSRL